MKKEYKYILWDMDGTILDFEASEKVAIRTLYGKHGFGQCTDEMIKLYSDINKKYWEALERGDMTKPEILVGRFKEFFEVVGADVSKAESFNSEYQLALGDTIVYCDGAKELVDQVSSDKRYVTAIITNGTLQAQKKKLSVSGLGEKFDYIFISELIGHEKPTPAFFVPVFEEMKLDKEKTLIVGDSLTSDIQGGVNTGIDTCWYNPKKQANTKGITATYEIYDLNELGSIIGL